MHNMTGSSGIQHSPATLRTSERKPNLLNCHNMHTNGTVVAACYPPYQLPQGNLTWHLCMKHALQEVKAAATWCRV